MFWGKNAKPVKHVVARYLCGDGISSSFLLKFTPKIIVASHRYGYSFNNVVGDSGTENRTAVRCLATSSVNDFLENYISGKEKEVFDIDLKITFNDLLTGSLTFIGADMPHLIKKYTTRLKILVR